MRSLLFAAILLALVGCGPKGSKESTAAGGGSGGGLLHEIASEMGGSKTATRNGVAYDLYYDVSDSSTNLRKPLSKLLERVGDTYPEAVPYTYSFYGENCDVQGEGITNIQNLRRANKAWVESKIHAKTTSLARVFERVKQRAEDAPETKFAALIVSDGGYEDTDAARGALRKLKDVPNVEALVFVGVHTGDNPKLQRLMDLTRILKENGEPQGPKVELVTDSNNEARVDSALATLKELVTSGKQVN